VLIVPEDDLSEALVADQGFGEHSGGASFHIAVAAGAKLFLEPIENTFGALGAAVKDGAVSPSFILERAAAVGAGWFHFYSLDAVGVALIHGWTSMAGVTGHRSPSLATLVLGGIKLERDFRGGGGRAKEPLLGLALAVA
jgi:hypothetical protein